MGARAGSCGCRRCAFGPDRSRAGAARWSAREHLRDGVHGALVMDDQEFITASAALAGDRARLKAMGMAAREAMLGLRPEQVAAEFDALLAGLARRGEDRAVLAS